MQVLEGSLINGELLFCGGSNWDLIGRNQLPKGGIKQNTLLISNVSIL